jgi:hypothetical protein
MPGEFTDYKPDLADLPRGISALGQGSMGGKAKGLAFLAEVREREPERWRMPHHEAITIPEAVVLTTEMYEDFLEGNALAQRMVQGGYEPIREAFREASFSPGAEQDLREVLSRMDFPLAVRSSSLLEDSQGFSFAGIYLTRFIPNRGSPEARLKALGEAVKQVYASTFNPNAMAYRKRHGLSGKKESMAVLIQRMVAREHGRYLYPTAAGVVFSRNYYPWTDRIAVSDGVVRLVYGLGTRAVGRNYARVFCPREPGLRPEGSVPADILRYSQEVFDALDGPTGELVSLRLEEVASQDADLWRITSRLLDDVFLDVYPDIQSEGRLVLTFEPLLSPDSPLPFLEIIRGLLTKLEEVFGLPVDVEFALEFGPRDAGLLHLLQVRPLASRDEGREIRREEIAKGKTIIETSRVMGNGVKERVRHIVYVSPESYLQEAPQATAASIGEINERLGGEEYLLIGPGRWGTTNPSLGVPVEYSQVSNVGAFVEVSHERFTPELSWGTHFFGDMLADQRFYLGVFPERGDVFDADWLSAQPRAKGTGEVVSWIQVPQGLTVVADGAKRMGRVVVPEGA